MSWKGASINIIIASVLVAAAVPFMVIPSISRIENGVMPRSERNAQNIASVYNAAIQAGADFGDRNDLRSIAELLREGVDGSGAFASATFWVRISPEEFDAAEEHLIYNEENRQILVNY